ncbi:nitrogenase molybdenum-cofactor synthesis protein NifE [Humidesulfovibrio mexicanus]|uniref:Nitrogenase molybdenum-cofactor synthesis protein NifE n=1 Tax=Humidesulfovibrio mexicanus TaxID=147047 RepID=A0A239AAB9_9BACT|nr:nitrogenase component 1 [Humidesulfovibrio mexicanus]SNR92469.1 nitrogenase molybdenum-cofactor synthesis protein NifE [Humidesulfovibrio mexicanus]
MRVDSASIKIENLKRKEDFPFARLEGVGPNLAGWGVIETCLLLPQSLCIMAGPSACLRHSAFMAHARGFTDRFYMLCTPEIDMTMGRHLEKVEKGIRDIASRRPEKVIFLIVGCPDYILGTDFTGVIERLEKDTGRRIILGAMAPITIGLKESPFTSAYTSFYDFLKRESSQPDPEAVNILGTFMPLSDSGELYQALRGAGIRRIHQIPLCADLEQFALMAGAASSLVLHPLANGLAGRMEKGLGIPSAFVPTAYGLDAIAGQYEKIAAAVGRKLDTEAFATAAKTAAAPLVARLKDKTLAVGCSINGSPWELASALVDFGLNVDTVFARGTFTPYEWRIIERLRETAPHIRACNVSHPSMCGETAPFDHIDVAYGVDAGIFCARAANVPLSRYQEQKHGYENTLWMLEQTREALENPVSNADWIYTHNFLI